MRRSYHFEDRVRLFRKSRCGLINAGGGISERKFDCLRPSSEVRAEATLALATAARERFVAERSRPELGQPLISPHAPASLRTKERSTTRQYFL
jgi:hypothetical protein